MISAELWDKLVSARTRDRHCPTSDIIFTGRIILAGIYGATINHLAGYRSATYTYRMLSLADTVDEACSFRRFLSASSGIGLEQTEAKVRI